MVTNRNGNLTSYSLADSYVIATSSRRWLDVEDKSVPPEQRVALRKLLFGNPLPELCYSTNPDAVPGWSRYLEGGTRSGTLKLESDNFTEAYFLGQKVYSLSGSDTAKNISKFKALSARSELDPSLYRRLDGDLSSDLVERRTDIRAVGGIHLVESSRRMTSKRSRLQCKFRTVGPNETRAFQ